MRLVEDRNDPVTIPRKPWRDRSPDAKGGAADQMGTHHACEPAPQAAMSAASSSPIAVAD